MSTASIQAIIFDLDGVIVSTDELHYTAWKSLAEQEGIYFDREINKRLRGVSRMESLEILLERSRKRYTVDEKLEMANRKNSVYVSLLGGLSPGDVTAENREALLLLRKKYKLAIGSSSKNAKLILKAIGLQDFFDCIADGTDIKRSKPDPEVFLAAANKLGIAALYCAVVEDARAGIDAARAAGMTAIATGDAYGYEKADRSVHSLYELTACFTADSGYRPTAANFCGSAGNGSVSAS